MSFSSSVLDAIDRLLNKYNGNPYDQSTNEGGMAIGGHRVNEIPMAQDVANVASAVATEAAAAATSATNAADSESNAATSESNAADSATSAAADADRAEAAAAQLDVQNNFVATTDPTANNDSADTAASGTEYNVGSVWINTTSDEAFRCVDASVGAAVWVPTTVTAEDLGTMAQRDANNVNMTGGQAAGITFAESNKFRRYDDVIVYRGTVTEATDKHVLTFRRAKRLYNIDVSTTSGSLDITLKKNGTGINFGGSPSTTVSVDDAQTEHAVNHSSLAYIDFAAGDTLSMDRGNLSDAENMELYLDLEDR